MIQFLWFGEFGFGKGIYPESAKEDKSRGIFRWLRLGFLEIRLFRRLPK
jgi:hypothetical protein